MPAISALPCDALFGSRMRSMLYLTSSEVSSRPLWNFTPLRSVKV